jgi:hypothetical protein
VGALAAFAFLAAPASASLGISLSKSSGPPTSVTRVQGSGFGANEAVDVFFDTSDLALAVTDGTGAFGPVAITVPASAVPGRHWLTAVGRRSGLAAQARFLVQTDWAQFRFGPQHKGFNPFENVLNPTNVAGLDLDWSAATGAIDFSSPAVANRVVYIGSLGSKVYAFKVGSGAPLWSATIGQVESSPAVANGVVYIGSDKLYAFKARSGALLWSAPVAVGPPSPAVANGIVYLGSDNGKLYAFNAANGTLLWSASTANAVESSSPAVANGVVYVGSFDNKLYAFKARSGALLWSAATGGFIGSSPAVVNGAVYVGSNDGKLYAYNLSNPPLTPARPDPATLQPDLNLRPAN